MQRLRDRSAHDRLRDVRRDDRSAVRDRRVRDGELQRAHLERALADGEVDRLAFRPWEPPALEEPLRRRDEARRGAGDVDRRRRAETEPPRPVLDEHSLPARIGAVDAVAEAIEPRVARLRERCVQRHARVDACFDVVEDEAAEIE